MSARCDICGKGPSTGHVRSRGGSSKWKLRKTPTKRRWEPNLHSMRALVKGAVTRVRVCTSCLRAGKVQKVV